MAFSAEKKAECVLRKNRSARPLVGARHVTLPPKRWDHGPSEMYAGAWVMGFDCEYVEEPVAASAPSRNTKASQRSLPTTQNRIISYQYSLSDLSEVYQGSILLEDGLSGRLKLKEILEQAFFGNGILASKVQGRTIYVYAHNTVAEWASLDDRMSLELDELRGKPCTVRKSLKLSLTDKNRNQAKVQVQFRDTAHIAASKVKSLAELSKVTPTRKIALPDGAIERMDEFFVFRTREFLRYGIADAQVTLEYPVLFAQKIEAMFPGFVGRYKARYPRRLPVPLTLGGVATNVFLDYLEEKLGLTIHDLIGTVMETRESSRRRGQKRVPAKTHLRHTTESLISEAYMGGLNIAFENGVRKEEGWCVLDVDFASAYPAALATMPLIDWRRQELYFSNREAYDDWAWNEKHRHGTLDLAFYEIKFAYPSHVRFPSLPIRTGNGLVFPLAGHTYTTFPELTLTNVRSSGAEVTILSEVVLPALVKDREDEPVRPFNLFFRHLSDIRQSHEKGTLEYLTLKEMMNALYGKLGQGVNDLRAGKKDPTPPSRITCPAYAAAVTGTVRAALSACFDICQSEGYEVLHATTDGFALLVEIPAEEAERAGTLKNLLPALYDRLHENDAIRVLIHGCKDLGLDDFLEIKKIADHHRTIRTRCNYFGLRGETKGFVHASDRITHEEWARMDESEFVETYERRGLATYRDIREGRELDLVSTVRDQRLNADYDYKRKLQQDGSTKPWPDLESYFVARKALDSVRQSGRRATPAAVAFNSLNVRVKTTNDAAVKMHILRAMVRPHNPWSTTLSHAKLAKLLGVPLSDVANASRRSRPFVPHRLPRCEVVRAIATQFSAALGLNLTDEMIDILVRA